MKLVFLFGDAADQGGIRAVNGIEIVCLSDRPELAEEAARWFHEKWGVPEEAYRESIGESLAGEAPVPAWFLALGDDRIVGGLGVIENDFHPRRDLTPNVCAVTVEEAYRGRGIAGELLHQAEEEMARRGIGTLYLVTDHTGFYERYGWEYLCPVTSDGEEEPSRMYVHRTGA
ncbi:MAG: GNAT family N-acetyltransferase [Clostridiales bacterium]|nr:GNAT family N-acetyltransferase [Clostridiales bacterium]